MSADSELSTNDADIVTTAALVAAADGHRFDVESVRARIYRIAETARGEWLMDSDWREQARSLVDLIASEHGFRGNADDYYRPENSYLDQVLEVRSGIPISLALVYLAVGRSLGLRVSGVNFPGHFLVAVQDPADLRRSVLLDPFSGVLLSEEDCKRRIKLMFGDQVELAAEHLQVASSRDIAMRMMGNLKTIRMQAQQWDRALLLLETMLQIAPDSTVDLRDRAVVYEHLECIDAAIADLKTLRALVSDDEVRDALDRKIAALQNRDRPVTH